MANVKVNTTNTSGGYQQSVNQNTEGVVAAGFYPQNASSSDANAGIQRDSSGNLELLAGGAVVAEARADGNFGIGTSNATSKLTVAGQIEATTTGYKFPDATTQTTSSGTISAIVSAVTTTSTAFTDITGLTASVSAATSYFFDAYIIWQMNNTAGGIGLAVNGPGGIGRVVDYTIQYQNFANDAAGTMQTVHATDYDSGYTIPTTTTAANTSYIARISGILVATTAGGTLALRFKTSDGAYTASIRPGSWLAIRKGTT